MVQPERKYLIGSYKYGFNGKEKEKEISKESYDFGARIYNGRIGRWFSVDPLQTEYPGLSPYNYVGNTPILAIDPDGRVIRIYYDGKNFIDYTPGMKVTIKNELLERVIAAAEYSMNTKIGKEIWTQLANSDGVLEIYPTQGANSDGNYKRNEFKSGLGRKSKDGNQYLIGTIEWDSDGMFEVIQSNGAGNFPTKIGFFAPSTVLVHEMGHAQEADDVMHSKESNAIINYNASAHEHLGQDEQYDTKEERKNTTTREHTYIRQINAWEQKNSLNPSYQPIRYNHMGALYPRIHLNVNKIDPSTYNEYREGRLENDGIKKYAWEYE